MKATDASETPAVPFEIQLKSSSWPDKTIADFTTCYKAIQLALRIIQTLIADVSFCTNHSG